MHSHYNKILYFITLILLLMVVGAIQLFDIHVVEIVELITVVCFFILFLIFKKIKDKMIFWAFVLYVVIDILGLFYGNNHISQIIPIIKILIYFIFARRVVRKFKLIKANKYVIILFSVIITLNVLLLYKAIWGMSNKFEAKTDGLLFFIYGLILISIAAISVNYNFRFNSKRSFYFLCFIFASIMSDASWYIGYFLDSDYSYYIDSIFYIITLFFMIKYALETSEEDDVILFVEDDD